MDCLRVSDQSSGVLKSNNIDRHRQHQQHPSVIHADNAMREMLLSDKDIAFSLLACNINVLERSKHIVFTILCQNVQILGPYYDLVSIFGYEASSGERVLKNTCRYCCIATKQDVFMYTGAIHFAINFLLDYFHTDLIELALARSILCEMHILEDIHESAIFNA